MKAPLKNIWNFVALLLFVNFCGCLFQSRQVGKPPGGKGYAVISYYSGFIHKSRISHLQYWDRADHHKVLWRNLAVEGLYDDENDLALFHGWLNQGPDQSMVDQASRFFAVTVVGQLPI